MHARILVMIAIGVMAPSIAQAQDQPNFAVFLLLCENHKTCERELSIEATSQAMLSRTSPPEYRACIPPGTDDKTSAAVVMDYYSRQRSVGWLPAWFIIRKAVIAKWPCPPDPLPPPSPKTFEELGCRKGVCGAVRPDGTIDPRP